MSSRSAVACCLAELAITAHHTVKLSQGYSEGVLRAFIRMASPPPPFARRDTTPTFGMRTKGDVAARQVAWLLGPRQGQLHAERDQQAATEPPEHEDEAHGCA